MVTREELYELVWSTPMIRVAEKFEVSGSYLARVYTEVCRVCGLHPALANQAMRHPLAIGIAGLRHRQA